MTAKIVNFPRKNKWSTEDAIRHLARVCNVVVQQQSNKWHFDHKMHEDDVSNLQHSIDIVNEKYDLKLK